MPQSINTYDHWTVLSSNIDRPLNACAAIAPAQRLRPAIVLRQVTMALS